jgi:hypothetical protein
VQAGPSAILMSGPGQIVSVAPGVLTVDNAFGTGFSPARAEHDGG